MTPTEMEDAIKFLDERLEGIQQILPTLATKDDLESGLAQVRAVAEQIRGDVQLLAGGYQSLGTDVRGITYTLDRLVTRLEQRGVI